jgi:hypothetical protein
MNGLPEISETPTPETLFGENEAVRWHGKPVQGTVWRWSSLIAIASALCLAVVSLVLPRFMLLIALPLAFWLAVWRIVQDTEAREVSRYIVTDQRLLIILGDQMRAIPLSDLEQPRITVHGDWLLRTRGGMAGLLSEAFGVPGARLDRLTLPPSDWQVVLEILSPQARPH